MLPTSLSILVTPPHALKRGMYICMYPLDVIFWRMRQDNPGIKMASICPISHITASAPDQSAPGLPSPSPHHGCHENWLFSDGHTGPVLSHSSSTAQSAAGRLQLCWHTSEQCLRSLLLHLIKLLASLSCMLLLHTHPYIVWLADKLHFSGAGGRPDCHQLQGAIHQQPCESLLRPQRWLDPLASVPGHPCN